MPVVAAQDRFGVAQNGLPRGVIGQEVDERIGKCQRLIGRQLHVTRCLPIDLSSDRRVQYDRRDTGGKRFQWCQSKTFVLRQKGKHRGAGIQVVECVISDVQTGVRSAIGPRPDSRE